MLSLVFGIALFLTGVAGPFLYEPALGLAVYAAFTHITPQQLGIASLHSPLVVATATLLSYFFVKYRGGKMAHLPAEVLLFGVMLCGMLLGALDAVNRPLAMEYFFIYLKYGAFLLLFVNMLHTLRQVEIFNNFLILSAAWLVYKCWDLRGTLAGRFENIDGGVVGDSNQFAAALVMLLPLVLVRFFRKTSRPLKIAAALGFFGMVMSVIISSSRGGFLGLVAIAAAFFLYYREHRKRIVVVALFFALAVSPFITDHYLSRISTIRSSDQSRDASAQGRLDFWRVAVSVWRRNPLYGCGLRNFIYYSAYEAEGKMWGQQGHVAHSLWFEALGEGGLMVFVPLVGMILLFFRRTARAKRKFAGDPEVYADIVAFQVGMVGFLVCATFVNRLIYEPIYWWCGLAYVYDRRIDHVVEDKGESRCQRPSILSASS